MDSAAKQRPEMGPQFNTGWDLVDKSSGWTAFGDLQVSTWWLKIDGGWLYKVTEWDEDGHYTLQVCFVPIANIQGG